MCYFSSDFFTVAPCQSSIFSLICEVAKSKLRSKLTSAASLQKLKVDIDEAKSFTILMSWLFFVNTALWS